MTNSLHSYLTHKEWVEILSSYSQKPNDNIISDDIKPLPLYHYLLFTIDIWSTVVWINPGSINQGSINSSIDVRINPYLIIGGSNQSVFDQLTFDQLMFNELTFDQSMFDELAFDQSMFNSINSHLINQSSMNRPSFIPSWWWWWWCTSSNSNFLFRYAGRQASEGTSSFAIQNEIRLLGMEA